MESPTDLLKQPREPAESQSTASPLPSNPTDHRLPPPPSPDLPMSELLQSEPVIDEHPPDICLLLRVHAEQRWLVSKVIPALRQLEPPPALQGEQKGAALAYLEVLWLEAGLRAAETDAAAAKLSLTGADPVDPAGATLLQQKAERYHAAVRRLRQAVDRRVRALTAPALPSPAQEPAGP